jgi:predicted RNA methylase
MSEQESGFVYKLADTEIRADRPEPMSINTKVIRYKKRMDPEEAVEALANGEYVLVVDYYSTGLEILNELKHFVQLKRHKQSYNGQRDNRAMFRECSNRLLLEVRKGNLAARKSPEIGWLQIFYPDQHTFLLPFPQVQGLNSAWQWYEKGISMPVLPRKIYPYFGTYFPTRFEHLVLLDRWLGRYRGNKAQGFDVGVGCGVISFMLLKHGFEQVIATDTNPNAIIGLHSEVKNKGFVAKMKLLHGDLFADSDDLADLIVFNPPWLPASHDGQGIDRAIYYDAELFPKFFSAAKERLRPGGKLVMLFSNLGQVSKVTDLHPIATEVAEGARFRKVDFLQHAVAPASNFTLRNQNWRGEELVELWVLERLES